MGRALSRAIVLILAVFMAIVMTSRVHNAWSWAEPTHVRMGIFEIAPLAYKDAQGNYKGSLITVIEEIGRKEDWKLEFVTCTFAECFEMLEKGQLDLMAPMAYTPERAKRLDYIEETFFMDWGEIYVPPDSNIKTILDLKGRKIAALKKTVQYEPFIAMARSFGIKFDTVFVDDYADVFRYVQDGKADALIVNRLYAERNAHNYNVSKTSIIFSPIDIRYATPKDKHSNLRAAIDRHLRLMMADQGSIYYRAIDEMFEGERRARTMPVWMKWAMLAAGGSAALFFGASILLRQQVMLRTRELRQVCEDLKASEEKYRDFINLSSEGFVSVDAEYRIIEANDAFLKMIGREKEHVLGVNAREFMSQTDAERAYDMFRKVAAMPHRVFEVRFRQSDGSEIPAIVNATARLSPSGLVLGSSAFITDVSALRASLREKEVLLKEVHHRVKNNLQIVSSLMSLQSRYTSSPSERRLFEESRARVMAMAMVHELLYQQGNFSSMDAGSYIGSLTSNLAGSFGLDGTDVKLVLDAEPISLSLDDLIPVGLIVTELFTNALKYGVNREGQPDIKVSIKCLGPDGCMIEVKDKGPGLPAGFDPKAEGGSTLGLQLVRTLVHQLDGVLECDSGTDGTAFRVRFSRKST